MSRRLKYATFCSGIECMSVACRGLPLDPVFFSEIEPFPCAVLKANYPTIPNLGDMSKIRRDENGNITNGTTTIPFPDGGIDILAAGCPCQDFSVAVKRAGGAEGSGTRSSLIFEFIRIIGEIRPRWFIYENVVGMLSTNEGRDFAHILLAFRDCGYSVAYRTLDAQYVRVDGMERAVPQRRRRVWVVGYSGADESRAAEILFEPDCVAGHTAPRRRTGEGFAYSLARRDRVDAGLVENASGTCEGRDGEIIGIINYLGNKGGAGASTDNISPTLSRPSGSDSHVIALDGDKLKPRTDQRKGGNGFGINEAGASYTLTGVDRHGVAYDMQAIGQYGNGEVASTVKSRDAKDATDIVVHCFENHAQDSRVKPIEVSDTRNQKDGTGGNNLPLVVHTAYKLDSMASNSMKSANPNSGIHETEVAACLDTTPPDPTKNQGGNVIVSTNSNGGDERNDACPKVAYGINPVMSGVMMETKPAEETAQTLRKSPGGENGIVQSLGFKYKQSEKSQKPFAENGEAQALSSGCHDSAVALGFKAGQSANGGLGDEREVSPTLSHQPSALEPTVCCNGPQPHSTTRGFGVDVAPTMGAAAGDSGNNKLFLAQPLSQMRYIVRRLTPTECMRLMGLPDDYCIPTGLRRFFDADGEPSPELVAEFQRIFDTFNAIMADYAHKKPPKPKSAKQVADWLKKISDPATCPDSPIYRACGNGWATNQPRWILLRLLQEDGIDPFTGDDINEKKD